MYFVYSEDAGAQRHQTEGKKKRILHIHDLCLERGEKREKLQGCTAETKEIVCFGGKTEDNHS